MEIEAESVAYILCHRNGVDVKSDQYLSGYIDGKESFCDLEIHRILQVAGQIESRLELAERISWDLGHSTGRDDGQPPNLGVTSSIPNSIQSSALPLQLQPPPLPQPTPLDASSLVDASIQLARAIQLFVRTLLKSVYSWLKRHKTCSW
jgi:hypothetical protein